MAIRVYKFLQADRTLRYRDGRVVENGKEYTVEGEARLCNHGFHGALRVEDALSYAPGPLLTMVELSGDIDCQDGEDKICGTTMLVVAEPLDITPLIWNVAREAYHQVETHANMFGVTEILPIVECLVAEVGYWESGSADRREYFALRDATNASFETARGGADWYDVHPALRGMYLANANVSLDCAEDKTWWIRNVISYVATWCGEMAAHLVKHTTWGGEVAMKAQTFLRGETHRDVTRFLGDLFQRDYLELLESTRRGE